MGTRNASKEFLVGKIAFDPNTNKGIGIITQVDETDIPFGEMDDYDTNIILTIGNAQYSLWDVLIPEIRHQQARWTASELIEYLPDWTNTQCVLALQEADFKWCPFELVWDAPDDDGAGQFHSNFKLGRD